MKRYQGQAIAIVMVILVVATVLGASLYSRMIKNREAIIDTKESARAIEQADTILDTVISSDIFTVQSAIDACLKKPEGCTFNSIVDFKTSFLGLYNIDSTILNEIPDTEWCSNTTTTTDTESSISIIFGYAGLGDGQDWEVGQVMALNLEGVSNVAGCNLTLSFGSSSSEEEVFTIKKVYRDVSGNVKPYVEDDMLMYCLPDDGTCSSVAPTTSVESFTSPNSISIPLYEVKDGYPLYEIRVLPLKGTLRISSQVSGATCAIGNNLNNYKMNSKVNCKGDYREKQVIIPNIHNVGYPTLFDYTIYNATGVLSPN
ncbi:MAG: hypothetical protein UR45_C0001G0024 [candidate division WS6 bacterium GW2011_WS6_33_547]|nr:MAG: hypothetical protein UR36_C0002G0068 [candidate division WS6 bacterium GW2011_GWF1_33_233]KKP55542.1 MAG: hypothetical protein UR45_C0001G0024 [candidate division WS6 bacterium GW2011_WS6_33_547]HBB64383.1 hypothetical protein [Patescibacteria group bacterium]